MSANCSAYAHSTLCSRFFSFNFTLNNLLSQCFNIRSSIYSFSAFFIMYILLLPVPILVLCLCYQKWRKQSSNSTATSHSDHFTYHSIFMQLFELTGVVFLSVSKYINLPDMLIFGVSILSLNSIGQALFHLLTCVEHYLAVVHPVTYLGLRQARGVRIRNMSIGCVWFLSFGWLALCYLTSFAVKFILNCCILVFLLILTSFCSISVLCALKRPGPGEVGGNREQVDKSKQRAFHTIMAIMGALLIRFSGNLFCNVIYCSFMVSNVCLVFLSIIWFERPSSLVLSLLFLYRNAGKLQCCKQNTEPA